jgi:hypothetical protein
VPDWLPALVNAGRTFVTIGAAELFWRRCLSLIFFVSRARARETKKTQSLARAGFADAAAFAAASLTAAAPGALPEGRSGRRDGHSRSNKGMPILT